MHRAVQLAGNLLLASSAPAAAQNPQDIPRTVVRAAEAVSDDSVAVVTARWRIDQWFKHTPLDGFRVIHLATHALIDESSLARTALTLAPGGGEDGFLSPPTSRASISRQSWSCFPPAVPQAGYR